MVARLGLRYDDRYLLHQRWQDLLDELRTIVSSVGLKEAAYSLDTQPSVLSQSLGERDRHYVRADWLPYLVEHTPNDRVVQVLASWRQLETQPRRVLTPEEQMRRLNAVLDSMPELGEVIRKKAGI